MTAAANDTIRLLLLDDDDGDAEIVRRLLSAIDDWEIEFRQARNIAEAVSAMAAETFDVVLSDFFLGAETGLDALAACREGGNENLPIIMLTGYSDESAAIDAMKSGASDYLKKSSLSTASLRRSIGNAVSRGRLKKALAKKRDELEKAHASLTTQHAELLASYHNLAHELKTPLTAAREFVSLVLDESDDPIADELKGYLKIALRNCDQMKRNINDILDVSSLETGKFTLTRTALDISGIIEQSVSSTEPAARAKSIRVRTHIQEELPPVDADAQRIFQVLSNLIGNATKFTPPDGTILITATLASAQDAERVRISVKDTGRGIEKDQLSKIFDRLHQTDAGDAAVHKGLGLGLSIASSIVELHGGKIEVLSEPGVGSEFHFELPAAVAAERVG